MRETIRKTFFNDLSTLIWNYKTSKLLGQGNILTEEDKQEVFSGNNSFAATCKGIFFGCQTREEIAFRFQELLNGRDEIKNTNIINALLELVANKIDNNEFCNQFFIEVQDCENATELQSRILYGIF